MDSNIIKRITFKLVFIFIIVIIFIIYIFFIGKSNYNRIYDENISERSGDYQMYISKYIYYLKSKQIEKSYSMLSDDCKNKNFDGDFNKYIAFINSLNINENSDIEYKLITIFKNKDNYPVYSNSLILNDKEINIQVVEYSPFDYKLYLVLE